MHLTLLLRRRWPWTMGQAAMAGLLAMRTPAQARSACAAATAAGRAQTRPRGRCGQTQPRARWSGCAHAHLSARVPSMCLSKCQVALPYDGLNTMRKAWHRASSEEAHKPRRTLWF